MARTPGSPDAGRPDAPRAFVLAAAAGLDVACEAGPYVPSFGGDDAAEQLERCAEAIDAIARRIEEALGLSTGPAGESIA